MVISQESPERKVQVTPETEMSKAYKRLTTACFKRIEERRLRRHISRERRTVWLRLSDEDRKQMMQLLGITHDPHSSEIFVREYSDKNEAKSDRWSYFSIDSHYLIRFMNYSHSWLEVKRYQNVAARTQSDTHPPFEIPGHNLTTSEINKTAEIIERGELLHH
ncbi:MAG: hypothetical protein A2152_00890 [Candidatus Levybacteria bacterium RBG_16_35_6]|nr:MAG: hypothetical protein A2152_00890 [Candidatus Levybacteria bacterium RBG_16_35_6]